MSLFFCLPFCFFGPTHGMWKFLDQRSNLGCSNSLCLWSDTWSPTHSTTKELQFAHFYMWITFSILVHFKLWMRLKISLFSYIYLTYFSEFIIAFYIFAFLQREYFYFILFFTFRFLSFFFLFLFFPFFFHMQCCTYCIWKFLGKELNSPQQQPGPLQWQCWVLNLLCHKGTPKRSSLWILYILSFVISICLLMFTW